MSHAANPPVWTPMKLDIFLQNLKYTLRTLGRDRGFTLVAVLILALAIGANIGVFSVVNTLLLRPLPFPESQQLVWIAPPPTGCGLSCATYSADAYEEFRAQSRAYQDVTGYMAFSTADNLRLTGRGEPEPATSIEVIGNFFQVLGVQPVMGRLFSPEEARGGPHPIALLANAYWRRQFASDPAIVGKAIELNGTPITIVGVLPESFDFGAVFSPGAKVDLFTPLDLNLERNWGNIVTLIGRGCDFTHRLCEPLESAFGSRRHARQGVCRPWRAGGEPRPHRAPAAYGKPRSLQCRRGPRARIGLDSNLLACASGISGSAPA